MSPTRRDFVKGVATVGAGLALGGLPLALLQQAAHAATEGPVGDAAKTAPAILYDLTQCVGCHLCEIACQKNKGLPDDVSLIKFRKPYPDNAPAEAWAVRRHQCLHCQSPGCATACPVAAMYKTPEGPVIYRAERCIGCRYCMNACPFGVPQFDWDNGVLDGAFVRKCDMCYPRQLEGKRPACIEACPAKAVIFGKRDELLAKAKDLIAKHPDHYVDHIYGEHEAGGTSFLLLSGVPFDQLGLPKPGDRALPPNTSKIMEATIPFALGWGTVLTGITVATHWRDSRMKENAAAAKPEHRPAKSEHKPGKGDAK